MIWESIQNFLSEEYKDYFQDGTYSKGPIYHSKTHSLEMELSLNSVLPFEAYDQLLTNMKLKTHAHVDVSIKSKNGIVDMYQLDQYVSYFVEKETDLKHYRFLHPYLENDLVTFSTKDESRFQKLKRSLPVLEKQLEQVGIQMEFVCKHITDDKQVETQHIDIPVLEVEKSVVKAAPRKNYRKEAPTEYAIADLQVGMKSVSITGHIFSIDMRTIKGGRHLQMLYISDYKDAIIAKRFEGARCSLDEMNEVKKGMYVRVVGEVTYDSYGKSDSLMIQRIEEIDPPKRKDTAKEKRTEWHVHSNFSEMDGVCSIEDYIQTAYDWGMDAMAICDHQVVQAFPMAQHKVSALNKKDPDRNFKMLYGCEFLLVDPNKTIVYQNDHRSLEEATYVIFDLETTGLSSRLDDIIEFGAVKMKHREVIERKQMFIDPKRPIPAHISKLTNIQQKDVQGQPSIEQALDEILAFFEDAILVAHNATFDIGFINAACRKLNKPELTNPYIDTHPLSVCLIPDAKAYRLGNVCRYYGINYDGEVAHRADYDADVLSEVLCHMLNQFSAQATLDDLAALKHPQGYKKAFPYHATVFAKNKDGLKELFELVTISHTQYLNDLVAAGEPRLPREILKQKLANGNLLVGSSCQKGEIFDLARTKDQQTLEKAIEFYDYIELQPLDCYANLLQPRGKDHTKAFQNVDELKVVLNFIIEAAKAKNKLIIASSDAHYVHPYQKRVRDIYINAKAIGNARHPLYIYDSDYRRNLPAPNQHLLTTNEMLDAFSWLGEQEAYDIVVKNPNKLKELVSPVYPIKDKLYPPDIEGSDQKLRDICYETAHKIYGPQLPDIVKKRLDRELDSIIGHGYYVVYYISHLLVKKSNEDGYLVGSRGSVGSSFVATMSNITEVNPLAPHYVCPNCHHYEFIEGEEVKSGFDLPDKPCPQCGTIMHGDGQDIPFETFLGFEGDKVPDIDLNFSGEYQANAHAFTKEIFGEDHVFRAGTVGTVQEKTAYGYIKGYEEELGLEAFPEAKRIDLAKECEGVKRTTGQHPGGIVVVPLDMDVHDFTPVQYPANNPKAEWKTTHFDFHQIHDNILKFDILGHVDPTAMKMLERITGLDVRKIPMNDPDTMAIFSGVDSLNIDTTRYHEITGAAGIPEFGTKFVRGILEKTKPTTFAELVSISGLSHGTDVWLGNAEELINQGTCTLSEVIGCRDDIMVVLIQMGLEPKTAFTIMESVRKGKGLKPEWIDIMKENNVPDWYIESCQKIKYMFPKAHAVAYVTMAVRIAWFKVHKPIAYYCMFFSIRCDAYDIDTMIAGEEAIRQRMTDIQRARQDNPKEVSDKELAIYDTLELALEMACRGYHFSNMSITRSQATEFIQDPDDPKSIIPPFSSLDGLGDNVGRSIVKARQEREFLSKEDILKRTQLSKSLLERMDKMNALEGLADENQMTLF